MKKTIAISSLLLGVVFLSGCSQQTSQVQPTSSSVAQNPTTNQQPPSTSADKKVANDSSCGSQVKDADGNSYGTVQVGTQCWMASNMNVGVKIDVKSEPSDNKKIEKWCYGNSDANCKSDGGLYNWDEAMQYSTKEGAQGICPTGWHIPTDTEQYTLENYLKDSGQACDSARKADGCAGAGTKLQVGGTSGMNLSLTGSRLTDGSFFTRSTSTNLWSSTSSGGNAWNRLLYSGFTTVFRYVVAQEAGLSVRCIKD